jgi:hypothetical protein
MVLNLLSKNCNTQSFKIALIQALQQMPNLSDCKNALVSVGCRSAMGATALSIMTLSITTVSIKTLSTTMLCQHAVSLCSVLRFIYYYSESHYAECRSAVP